MNSTVEQRSGIVAVVGRPNVGKSTLVNALVGEKISIVTSKPQTTRHAITGILNHAAGQAVFIDTPGLHDIAGKLINRTMNRAAAGSIEGADLVSFVVEAGAWKSADDFVLERVTAADVPCILLVNKIDRVRPKSALLPYLDEAAGRGRFAEVVPVSALKEDNLDTLRDVIFGLLPAGSALYPPDASTDRGLEFRVAEVLREKLMQSLRDEVPYGLSVEINELEEDGERVLVDAIIWVDKESHKGIVVGRGGEQLKKLGKAARLDLNRIFSRRFHLETRVKLKRNWADNAQALRQLGYDAGA